MSAEPTNALYTVCDRCGYFYGDMRLYDGAGVECPECGHGAAWVFPTLEAALRFQGQVRR